MNEFVAAISSIKAAIDVVKGFASLKTEYEIKSTTSSLLDALIDIQHKLLSIQSSYQVLLDDKNAIEKKVKELEEWNTNKLNYSLYEIARGAVVYISQKSENPNNKLMWYCQNCLDNNHKISILQLSEKGNNAMPNDVYSCFNCTNKIIAPNANYVKPKKIDLEPPIDRSGEYTF